MPIVILTICVVFIVYTLFDLIKNVQLNKRQKTTFTFLICAFPLLGSFIYVYSKILFIKK